MSDQCAHCTLRGNYDGCIKTPCNRHESWIDLKRIEKIKNLAYVVRALLEYIDAIPDDVAANFPAMPGIDRDLVDSVLK